MRLLRALIVPLLTIIVIILLDNKPPGSLPARVSAADFPDYPARFGRRVAGEAGDADELL